MYYFHLPVYSSEWLRIYQFPLNQTGFIVWNVLSYMYNRCWGQHSAVLIFSEMNSPNWYRLLNMSCFFRLCALSKSNFKAFSPQQKQVALHHWHHIASRCHALHTNASRLCAHGNACYIVAVTQDTAVVGLRPLVCRDCGFEFRRGQCCLLSGRRLCEESIPSRGVLLSAYVSLNVIIR
jgi:hypothetical protein